MIDSEFCEFQKLVLGAAEFQTVLRGHRTFLAAVARLSLIENSTVQDSIERILHCCIRFIALCRVINEEDGFNAEQVKPSSVDRRIPVVIPIDEIAAVRSDFISQVSFLFQIMRKVENRGFMFRLDFNGFLSSLVPTQV